MSPDNRPVPNPSRTLEAAPAWESAVATLHPSYFAMVMATGIVSLAAHLVAFERIAIALFWLNNVFYAVLWALSIVRIVQYPRLVLADLSDHGRAVGFFTLVAATCVLGTQWWIIANAWRTAAAFWMLGIFLWAALTYGVLFVLTVKEEKPTLAEGINGGWLVAVVAGQSVAVLGSDLAPGFGGWSPQVLCFCLVMWLGSGMLYIWIISLIFYRYTFFRLTPWDLAPPYWINMGAVAISSLAGSTLIACAPALSLLGELLPFLLGLTLLFWATATWWIPMLLILGIWRHLWRRFPLRYDPLYWGAVFPLGMYAVATFRLGQVIGMPLLVSLAEWFLAVALVAWTLTFAGLVHRMLMRQTADRAR